MKKIVITVLFAAALSAFGSTGAADEREDSYEDRKKEAQERAESADVKERAEDVDAGDAAEVGRDRRQERRQDR